MRMVSRETLQHLAALGDVPSPVGFGATRDRILVTSVRSIGVEPPLLVSGAGHDAQNPALAGVPTGMLFVRSTGGSHTPTEFASITDADAGSRVLERAIAELVGV